MFVGSIALPGSEFVQDDDPDATTAPARKSISPDVYDTVVKQGDAGTQQGQLPPTVQSPRLGAEDSTPLRFIPVRKHAEGGLGEIHVARDCELNREVALKKIKPSRHDDKESQLQFLLEGEITGSLEHPGIVPVYAMGIDSSGRPFYAMRFIRGNSLAKEIEQFHSPASPMTTGQRELAMRKMLRRFTDVCNAVDYAHSRGVLHRDLKPDNVMVGPYGETLVVDWGLAKLIDQPANDEDRSQEPAFLSGTIPNVNRISSRGVVGSLPYMSPEQANGLFDELTPACDIFSLGGILYNLLTGRTLYTGGSMSEVLQKARQRECVPARQIDSSIHPALEAICERATDKSPQERYESARLLADEIDAYLADQPVDAYDEPISAQVRRWMRQHPRIVSTVLSALLVASVGLTFGLGILSNKNAEISQQKEVATQNLQAARTAVRESLVRISEDPQLKQEGLAKLRSRLLEAPASFYTDFLKQTPNDPALRFEQAEWRYLLGRITVQIGSQQEAIEHFQASYRLCKDLLQIDPRENSWLLKASQSSVAIAGIQQSFGEFEQAIESANESRVLAERLPDSSQDRDELRARALNVIASIQLVQSDFETLAATLDEIDKFGEGLSDSMQQESDRIRATMLADQGRVVECETVLKAGLERLQNSSPSSTDADKAATQQAELHNSLGIHYVSTGRPNAALEQFTKGQAIAEDLADRHRDDVYFQELLSNFENNLTLPYSDMGIRPDPSAIREQLDRSLEKTRSAARTNPADYVNTLSIARSLMNRGEEKLDAGNSDTAKADFDEAKSITDELLGKFPDLVEIQQVRNRLMFNESTRLAANNQTTQAIPKCRQAMVQTQSLIDRGIVAAFASRADGHRRLAQFAIQAGKWDVAKSEINQWRDLYEQVPSTYRDAPAHSQQLAWAAQNMVDVHYGENRYDDAFAEVENALEIRGKLVKRFPDEPFFASQLGWLHNWYGFQLLSIRGESAMPDALIQMRAGCSELQKVPTQWRNNSSLQGQIDAEKFLADLNIESGDFETALDRYQFAIECSDALFDRNQQFQNLIQQSQLCTAKSQVLALLERNEEMDAALVTARSVVERILIEQPDHEGAKRQRYAVLVTHGNRMRLREKFAEALEYFEQAIDVGGHEDLTLARILQASMQVRIGNYQTGVEIAKSSLFANAVLPEDRYNAACVYALASAAASQDGDLASDERKSVANRFAASAVNLLDEAFESPDYAIESNIEVLLTDQELESLRKREDYQALVKQLQHLP
ncbi:Serine/threonine protein kinase [Neorhodopirellula lusitana]|uniref:Serine/threonine protein kinase n=1 Tax=Neorhodopirellula lusitana TaxID=445327 RepID=A0ABY1QRZ1_9BACT|nr:Serine/threonine protein kinase [Neorhodopirellula lusitana]